MKRLRSLLCLSFLSRTVAQACVVACGVYCSSAQSQTRGPFELPTDYPLTDLHLSIPSASPDVIDAGKQGLGLQLSWSNVSNYAVEGEQEEGDIPSNSDECTSCYIVDAEIRKARFRYRTGLDEATDIQFHVPIIWRGGGTLDNAVEQFHEAVGVSRGVRGQVRQDQYEISGRDEDSSFSFDNDGFALGNLVTGLKRILHQSEHSTTSIETLLSLPTSTGSFGHKGVDFAGVLLHREMFSDFAFFFGGGPVVKSDTSHSGVDYRRVHGEGFATFEYMYSRNLSLIVGTHASTRIIEGIAGHPGPAAYLDTGIKAGAYGLNWELLLRENISSGSGTTDFTMLLGVSVVY